MTIEDEIKKEKGNQGGWRVLIRRKRRCHIIWVLWPTIWPFLWIKCWVIEDLEQKHDMICLMLKIILFCCAVLSSSVMSDSLQPCSLPGSSVHGDSPGKNTGVGCHALLQGIFPTQGSNPGLPHCRQVLYHLSHQGSHQEDCYVKGT